MDIQAGWEMLVAFGGDIGEDAAKCRYHGADHGLFLALE
jgi:hypothetical protein